MILTPEQLKKVFDRKDEIIHKILCPNESWSNKYPISYSFNFLGWFDLMNWLTKEKSALYEVFVEWYKRYKSTTRYLSDNIKDFDENLPSLFVQWLTESEEGMWECTHKSPTGLKTGRILTELGKLIKGIVG